MNKTISRLTLCFLIIALFSCKKNTSTQNEQTQIEFNFSLNALKSAKTNTVDSSGLSTLSSVLVTIEDGSGKTIKNSEKIELFSMNGNYISKPLALPKGNYKLTGFLVLDWKNNIVYASPLKNSPLAYLVTNPLPIAFNANTDNVVKVTPEVINASAKTPADFGYASFSFNIAQSFDFKVGTFIYNDTIKNFKLTASTISVYSDSLNIFSGNLSVNTEGALVNIYDKIGVTNTITLPERYNNYTLVISNPGYKTYSQIFTKEELKLHLRSVDKGPLVVILNKSSLNDGLVAYYKFNGDVLDYSGYNNNGAYYGRGLYTSGKQNTANSALDFNGSSDYVEIQNSTSLNPDQISICAWYYALSFYGNGANSLVTKRKTTSGPVENQYHLNVLSDSYGGDANAPHMRQFGFSITTNQGAFPVTTTGTGNFSYKFYQYQLYQWNFVVGTYDGDSVKLYVNGDLKAWRSATGNLIKTTNDLFIGYFPYLARPDNDYTAGRIDEVRIYNRALSSYEIMKLYQQ